MIKTSNRKKIDRLKLKPETLRLMAVQELAAVAGASGTSWGQQGNSNDTCCQI